MAGIQSWEFYFEPLESIRLFRDFITSNSFAIDIAIFVLLWVIVTSYIFYTIAVRKDIRIQKLVDCFPGPPTIPIFGNSHTLMRPNEELINLKDEWGKVYGSVFRVWMANLPFVVFASGSSAEKILGSNVHIEKSIEYTAFEPWLGKGLLTASGKKWASRRKLLTPTFHFKILEDFFEVFNEQSEVLVRILENECCHRKPFNVYPYITRCALDIICESAMGKKVNAQTDRDFSYVKAVYGLAEIFVHRLTRPWLRYEMIFQLSPEGWKLRKYLKIVHAFTEQVIRERREQRRREQINNEKFQSSTTTSDEDDIAFKKKKRKAFLDLMLDLSEDGNTLSQADIREEVDTFMFEGHDTTAANLNWTLFLLATYPEHQRKVQKELDEIFEEDRSQTITMSDTAKMKYLECCIKESLRLYPSVPIMSRKLIEDCHVDDGLIAPAGAVAVIVPFLIHRDPKMYPDPETFNPERFTHENSIGRHPYSYVPFSAGPRNCIGQKFAMYEEKTILAHVLRNFNLEAAERREDVKMVPDMILRPANGLHIKLSKRT